MIEIEKITDGSMNGKTVWICHYNQPDLNKKPLRNIPPTKVIIRPKEEYPKSRTLYYSESFFSPIHTDGSVLKKYYSPGDNTGFRYRPPNFVSASYSRLDIEKVWSDQIIDVIDRVQIEIDTAASDWTDMQKDLRSKIV